jgi:hypothetical protein
MRAIVFAFTIALFGLISSTQSFTQTAQPVSAFDKQLIDQENKLLHDAQAKNQNAVDHLVADDFKGIGENGDFYDRGEVVESATHGMPAGTSAYEFEVIKLNDFSAVVTYNLILPEEHPRYRHMADTWAKVGGQWKLKFRQFTPNLWSENDTD